MTFTVKGQRVVVLGAARSGAAAARLLAERGARVTLSDSGDPLDAAAREALAQSGVVLELGRPQPDAFADADLIVLSPGVPPTLAAVAAARRAGVPVIGEIELASRWLSGRIVAITGTKGKSTTTTLTGRMFAAGGLRALVGGNIGTPLSAQVAASTPETFHIVEVSSFQLETTERFHPWVAVLLNLSSDHLDRHGSMEAYGAAKARIFANQEAGDWAVINADDPATLALARAARAKKLLFAREQPLDDGVVIRGGQIRELAAGVDTPLLPVSAVRLLGSHLLTDVMAAAAVARIAGVPPAAMAQAVETFTGLEHALEPVAAVRGVQFVNDSKATNVDAARQAIESFGSGLVVIMGGRFKSGDFRTLREPLRARGARVVAIGEAAPMIREALSGAVEVTEAPSLPAAVRAAAAQAPAGGTVLLAPACASFDMFRDYAERGLVFKEEVARLAAEDAAHER